MIEGGDGSGKTTLLKSVGEVFPLKKFRLTREPGGTPLSEIIRGVMLSDEARRASAETQFCLAWAARAHHLQNLVVPALESGVHVISDRFDSSTFAFQVHGQEAPHLEGLFREIRRIYLGRYAPDMYIFLHVSPKVGMRRTAGRVGERNHFDRRKFEFHQKVTEGYLDFFKKINPPHVIIDASKSLEEVKRNFHQALCNIIGRK